MKLEGENKSEGEKQAMSQHHLERLEDSPPTHHPHRYTHSNSPTETHNYTQSRPSGALYIRNRRLIQETLKMKRQRHWWRWESSPEEATLSDNQVNCWGLWFWLAKGRNCP